jgi:transposase-like protein
MLQEVLEAEMDAALQAAKSERTSGRLGHRSGYYPRTFVSIRPTGDLLVGGAETL